MLELVNISKSYGQKQVLDQVNLCLPEAQSIVLSGRSGGGKTTLIKIIAGLLSDYSGELLLHGERLAKSVRQRSFDQCAKIQYIFQDPYSSLDSKKTVQETLHKTLEFCRRNHHEALEPEEALALVDPQMLRLWERPIATLSGGQRQKICIARALIPKPEIILADEICSMLDMESSLQIYDSLHQLKERFAVSILIVMHDIDFTYNKWERIVLLDQAKIVENIGFSSFLDHAESPYARKLIEAYDYFEKRRQK